VHIWGCHLNGGHLVFQAGVTFGQYANTPLRLSMHTSPSHRLAALTPGDISAVIQMAWEDRTTFETIRERTGLSEPEVIRLMRSELQASSFKMWRERTRGRVTKHRALRPTQMKFDDRAVANHRRANA